MTSSDALCTVLAWDSRHWGVTTVRVCDDSVRAGLVADADAWCPAKRVGIAYLLSGVEDTRSVTAAVRLGFDLVDVRVTLRAPIRRPLERPIMPAAGVAVRDQEPGDVEALEAIASSAYGDSRFYADRHFRRDRVDDLYRQWIRRSCNATHGLVLVAEEGGVPVGYVTGGLSDGEAAIELVGVAKTHRGAGVGDALIATATERFESAGAQAIRVATQGRNIGAQRLYQRHRFVTDRIELWLHKWYPTAVD